MQDKISEIEIRNTEFKKLKLQNIVTEKAIYRFGQFCDVKLVHIQQPKGVLFSEDMKSRKYALKVIYKERIRAVSDNYQRQYQNIFNEIYALYLISHPNVVKIYWHFQDDENIYILTEHAGITLYKYMRKTTLNEDKIKPIFKQICQGLEAIHAKKIVHRDLSLDNIVINTDTNQVNIIDFGNAIQFTGGRTTALGTLTIMAPQVYHQKKYNTKADVWSLGVILYELFHKRNPFVNEEQQYTEEEFSQKRDTLQYNIDDSVVSTQAKKLIVKMLSINPEQRPLPEQILNSQWLAGQKPISSKFINQKQPSEEHLVNNQYSLPNQSQYPITNQQEDKKTKQISNRKSFFALSEDKLSNYKDNRIQAQKHSQEQANHQDDFYFDKIINKMTMNNSVQQLQERLRKLLIIRTQELAKNKQLTLKLLQTEKRKIQKEKHMIANKK